MSLFSKIGGVLGRVGRVASFIPGVGGVAGRVATAIGAVAAATRKPTQAGLPGIPRAGLPARIGRGVGRALPGIGRVAGSAAIGVGAAALFNADGTPKKKRRRMNPCNDKALKRALRRIEAYDKVRKRVDASLRKACPPQRRRTTPSRKC